MEIVAGSYEELVIGLTVKQEADEWQLTESFTEKLIGSIRCVAVSDRGLLASGGTDEIIRIFDLKKHRLVGTLTHHSGTITSLEFCQSHLFSTSEDGTLCLWRVTTWEPERTFKGHKKAVRCAAVHPTGKLTLSLGEDRTLRLWNNMTGRSAYIYNMEQSGELVRWSPGGQYYVVVFRNRLEVYSIESKGLHRTIQTAQKVNSIVFVSDTVVAYGGEGVIEGGEREKAAVFFTDILQGHRLSKTTTECNRIRDLAVCDKCLALVGSDGTVSVYQFSTPSKSKVEVKMLTSRNISLRLTSVAMFVPQNTRKNTIKTVHEARVETELADVEEPSPKREKKKKKVKLEETEEEEEREKKKAVKIQKEEEEEEEKKIVKKKKGKKIVVEEEVGEKKAIKTKKVEEEEEEEVSREKKTNMAGVKEGKNSPKGKKNKRKAEREEDFTESEEEEDEDDERKTVKRKKKKKMEERQ